MGKQLTYGYDDQPLTHQPRVIFDYKTNIAAELYWDANGNLSQIADCNSGNARFHLWNEENRLHALQNDNKGKYNGSQLNLEFEAKVFVIMSGLPTGFYYGMDEDYCSSLQKMDIKEFTQPQFISEYIKQANIYSGYNKDNTIGGPSYWTPTTISPFNLISIIKRQK